ncbi:MAG: hypothetical protein JO250_21015 [Armatimonadetes bacterium]|nr:hypothetical protein [Armatimonadota bacterium]
MAAERGPFTLFALLEREDTPGRWDVLVSAPWLPTGRKGLLTVAEALTARMTPEEAVQIGRIVTLAPASPFVWSLRQTAARHGLTDGWPVPLGRQAVNGTEIERGFILAAGEPEAAAGHVGALAA